MNHDRLSISIMYTACILGFNTGGFLLQFFGVRDDCNSLKLSGHGGMSLTLPETNIAPENGWLEYVGIY